MVPASCIVVLKDLGRVPGIENVVDLVLLPPRQRLTQNLPGLVNVEVPGTQEPEDVLVFWDLWRGRKVSSNVKLLREKSKLPREQDSPTLTSYQEQAALPHYSEPAFLHASENQDIGLSNRHGTALQLRQVKQRHTLLNMKPFNIQR